MADRLTIGEVIGILHPLRGGGSIDARDPIGPVTTDSREVVPGGVFVALAGERVDGADFVEEAIRNLMREGRPDKYRPRPIPERFTPWRTLFGAENTAALLAAKTPPGIDEAVAAKILKTMGYKAPLALKAVNQIIDRQASASLDEGIEIELDNLAAIFSTADALEGLSSLGRKKPEYKGK